MARRRTRILWCAALACLAWGLTLGVHSWSYVRAYCEGYDAYDQPKVYVHMEPVYSTTGIPWVFTWSKDALPYSLRIAVTTDDRLAGDGVVIESLQVEYEDGETYPAIVPDCARGGPFREFEPVPSDRVPGRTFRMARVDVDKAVWRRGSFKMSIKGYIYGDRNIPFVRNLRMDYSCEHNLCIGWWLIAMSAAG